MLKKVFLLSVLVFLFEASFGQNKEYAKSVIDTLCGPYFSGRGYVDDGQQKAALYLAQQFEAIGLQKIDESYLQDFSFDVNTFPGKMSVKLGNKTLIPGADYLVSPSAPSVKGKFKTVIIDRENLADEKKWPELLTKLSKKVLLVRPAEQELNKEANENVQNFLQFLQYDERSPVLGVVDFINTKLTWSVAREQSPRPYIQVRSFLFSEDFVTAQLDIEAKLINTTCQNVIGKISGKRSDSTVVVTAHYDHLGRMGQATYFPGANDNASGTALLLDLASYFSKVNKKPEFDMVFIAFGGEEAGLVGSFWFVEHPLILLGRIKFLVNLDLAGTGDDGIQVVNGSIFKKEFLLLNTINDTNVWLPKVKIRGEACNSDHCPFYRKGVPSFFIYTLGGITAYHDIYDKAETLPLTAYDNYFLLLSSFLVDLP